MGPTSPRIGGVTVCLAALAVCAATACADDRDQGMGDQPAKVKPNALGSGLRLRDIVDPASKKHPKNDETVFVTGTSIVTVDNFDETGDGKSRGTIYIQDANSHAPYSGIGLYAPSFVPADLKVAPGDVLDFLGPYQQNASIGAAVFNEGQFLVQLARPIGTYRFDGPPPEPTEIDVNDLVDYNVGRKWVGMLVTAKNVQIQAEPYSKGGRTTACIGGACESIKSNPPQISNELFDLQQSMVPYGKTFASVTGVVTFFFSLKIAPRSAADLVEAK